MYFGRRTIKTYVTPAGKNIYREWFAELQDKRAKNIIHSRIERLADGNAGDYKWIGEDIFELRIHFGPGYRVYCGNDGQDVVILLCGGDKSSQDRDIFRAINYWKEYRSRS